MLSVAYIGSPMAFSRKRAFEWLVDYAVNMLRDFSDSKEDGGVEVQAEILPRAKVGNLAMAAAVGGEPPSKKLKSSTMGGVLPTGPAKENAMAAGKAAGGRKKKSMSPGQPAIQLHFNALPAPGSTIEVTQHVPDYTGKLQTATFVVNGVSILDATKRTVAFSGLRHTVNVAAKHFQGAERRLGELRQAEVVQLGCYGKRGAKGAWRTRRA